MSLLLAKNMLHIYTVRFRQKKFLKMGKALAGLAGLIVLPSMIVIQTNGLFNMWLLTPGGPELLLNFVSVSLFGVMVLLFLTGIPVAMHHFFLAKDLSMLLAFPLDPRQVYLHKFLETAVSNLGMFVLLGLPVLFSMMLAVKFSILSLILIAVTCLLFIAIPTGLSVLFSLMLARLFSIKKMRRLATLLLGMFVILAWAGFQFVRLSRLDPSSVDFDPAAMHTISTALQKFNFFLLPSSWVVRSLWASFRGQWLTASACLAALFVFSMLAAILSAHWRSRLDRCDIRIESAGRVGAVKTSSLTSPRLRFYQALFVKDVRLILRDPRFFQSNLILLAMMAVSPFFVQTEKIGASGTLDVLAPYIPLTILALIISAAIGVQNLPMERLSFQYLKLAPVRLRDVLLVKSMRATLLVISVSSVAIFIAAWRFGTPSKWLLPVIAANWLLALGGTSLGQAFGAIAGKFDWTDPRYMVDLSWTFLSTLAQFVYGALGIGLFALGCYLHQCAVAFVIFFIYVCLVFEMGLRIASRRLQNLDWIY